MHKILLFIRFNRLPSILGSFLLSLHNHFCHSGLSIPSSSFWNSKPALEDVFMFVSYTWDNVQVQVQVVQSTPPSLSILVSSGILSWVLSWYWMGWSWISSKRRLTDHGCLPICILSRNLSSCGPWVCPHAFTWDVHLLVSSISEIRSMILSLSIPWFVLGFPGFFLW